MHAHFWAQNYLELVSNTFAVLGRVKRQHPPPVLPDIYLANGFYLAPSSPWALGPVVLADPIRERAHLVGRCDQRRVARNYHNLVARPNALGRDETCREPRRSEGGRFSSDATQGRGERKGKGMEKSGKDKIGASIIARLRESKASCGASPQWKLSFCRRVVSGAAIEA